MTDSPRATQAAGRHDVEEVRPTGAARGHEEPVLAGVRLELRDDGVEGGA